jgi:hypothetical protein
MKEHFWQFRISEVESSLGDRGVAFFARKSSEMAAMSGFLVIETKSVKLDRWHNDILMVSGIAVLGG